jgi:uncharacterized protein
LADYHPLYRSFFDHYHKGEYWEAHEVLEELWQGQRDNDFYHGLIQIAAIMHQLQRGKIRGARKLAFSARRYLVPYAPKNEGVNVELVLEWLEQTLERLPEHREIMAKGEVEKLNIPVCPLPVFT